MLLNTKMLNDNWKSWNNFSFHRSENAIKTSFTTRPRLMKCFLHANRKSWESRLRKVFRQADQTLWISKQKLNLLGQLIASWDCKQTRGKTFTKPKAEVWHQIWQLCFEWIRPSCNLISAFMIVFASILNLIHSWQSENYGDEWNWCNKHFARRLNDGA